MIVEPSICAYILLSSAYPQISWFGAVTPRRSNPHARWGCRDVLEGVLLLMGQEDTSWAAMKAFLGKRSVKEDIINYDARR